MIPETNSDNGLGLKCVEICCSLKITQYHVGNEKRGSVESEGAAPAKSGFEQVRKNPSPIFEDSIKEPLRPALTNRFAKANLPQSRCGRSPQFLVERDGRMRRRTWWHVLRLRLATGREPSLRMTDFWGDGEKTTTRAEGSEVLEEAGVE